MLKLLDITQPTFDAAAVVYEAVYEVASEAVSDAASAVDTSKFHELSRKTN